jgi:hypothetical protein
VRVVLILNPAADLEFVRQAEMLLEGVSTPAELQLALRATYPNCLVRAREISSEPRVAWYVYREGRWIPSVQPEGG